VTTASSNTPVSGSEVSLGVDTRVVRWCQIRQILPKITVFQNICQFLWQYFLMPKICYFERPIVTIKINKIYQIYYQNFRKYRSDNMSEYDLPPEELL